MESVHALKDSVHDVPRSAYDYVDGMIAALIERFELHGSTSLIRRTYRNIFKYSLDFPQGTRPPDYSRLNHDGTPIQFAVTLGPSRHTLQFLGEAGSSDMVASDRIRVNLNCIAGLAESFHTDESLASVSRILDLLAPDTDIDLLTDPGGAYWVGAAFTAGSLPYLKIYINSRWGKENERWRRLSRFAAFFGQSAQWEDISARLAPDLQPLGTSITLKGDKPPLGRIYLSAFGRYMSYFEELADVSGGADFRRHLRTFGKCVLGDDYRYPMQTAVYSFGFGNNQEQNQKLELCAHCLFASDVEAVDRLRYWFEEAHLDATDYWDMLEILSAGYLNDKTPDLHCFAGVGLRDGAPYATIYLKPRLSAS